MMWIKVCGMREKDNIQSIHELNIDLMGFIFYENSKRFVGKDFEMPLIRKQKVGVFVNEKLDKIIDIYYQYQLDFIQLHGDENMADCQKLKEKNIKIIKAFSIDDNFDFQFVKDFEPFVNYFLFDAKGKERGGNGVHFNWQKLNEYHGNIPFFLSGGITLQDAHNIQKLSFPKMIGVDINSGFEEKAGLKKISTIQEFLISIKNTQNNEKIHTN